MTPEQLAACLNLVASRIDSSETPSRTAVASDIRAIVAMMDSDGAHFAGFLDSLLRFKPGSHPSEVSEPTRSDWLDAWEIFKKYKTNSVYRSLDVFRIAINKAIGGGELDRFLTGNNIPIEDVKEMKRLLKIEETVPTDNDWVNAWNIFKSNEICSVSNLNSFKEAINGAVVNGNIDTYLNGIKNAKKIKNLLKI